MPFHRRLRKERSLRGWSQAELARRSLISRSQVSHFELGSRRPGSKVLARLASALGLTPADLLGDSPCEPNPRGWPAWQNTALWERFAPRPRRYRLDRERDNWVRLRAARKSYPLLYSVHLARAIELHGRPALSELLHFACCDSGLEMLAWLRILGWAMISYVSLARPGWRHLPVIEDPSGHVVGDRIWLVLVFEKPFLCALFPQVRVQTVGSPFRMDLLACLRVDNRLIWVNVEIDGPFHNEAYDRKRQALIGLPRVTLTEKDVCASDFKQRLLEKLARAAGIQNAA